MENVTQAAGLAKALQDLIKAWQSGRRSKDAIRHMASESGINYKTLLGMQNGEHQSHQTDTLIRLARFVYFDDVAMLFLHKYVPILKPLIEWNQFPQSAGSSLLESPEGEYEAAAELFSFQGSKNLVAAVDETKVVTRRIHETQERASALLKDAKDIRDSWFEIYQHCGWEGSKGVAVVLCHKGIPQYHTLPTDLFQCRADNFKYLMTHFSDGRSISLILDRWTSKLCHHEPALNISDGSDLESPSARALWSYRNYKPDWVAQNSQGIGTFMARKLMQCKDRIMNASLEISRSAPEQSQVCTQDPLDCGLPNMPPSDTEAESKIKIHPFWLVLCALIAAAMCSKNKGTSVSGSFESKTLLVSDENFSAFAASYPSFKPPFLHHDVVWTPTGISLAKGIICLESPDHEPLLVYKQAAQDYFEGDAKIKVRDLVTCFQ